MLIKIGYQKIKGLELPVFIDLTKSCHWLITGSSGSGKSVATLFWLYSLKKIQNLEIWIADFKGSGDFIGIGDKYSEFAECADMIEEYYQRFTENKNERLGIKRILVFDEFSAFCTWLEISDKAKYKRLQGYITEILMLGRELPSYGSNCGSAWLWTTSQRPDSDYYPKGIRENCQIKICMGIANAEMRKMLNLEKEDIPETYMGDRGTGILSEHGKEIRIIIIPEISKKDIKLLLSNKAAERSGGSCSSFVAPT